jgi:hypothetical protein
VVLPAPLAPISRHLLPGPSSRFMSVMRGPWPGMGRPSGGRGGKKVCRRGRGGVDGLMGRAQGGGGGDRCATGVCGCQQP